jgi:hypothetical protein
VRTGMRTVFIPAALRVFTSSCVNQVDLKTTSPTLMDDQDEENSTSAPRTSRPLCRDKRVRKYYGDRRRDQRSTIADGDLVLTIQRQYKLSNRHRFVHPSLPILVVSIGVEFIAFLCG